VGTNVRRLPGPGAKALELEFNTVKRDWLELLRRYSERDAVVVEARRQLAVNRYRAGPRCQNGAV
jgi:hypothetical protein